MKCRFLVIAVALLSAGCVSRPVRDPEKAREYLDRAKLDEGMGNRLGATTGYTNAINFDPSLVEAYLRRARLFGAEGNLDAAIVDLNRAISLSPRLDHAYHLRALAREQRGELEKALRDMDRAISLNQQSAGHFNHRGYLKGHRGDYIGAMLDLNRALDLDPKLQAALYNRAFVSFCQLDLRLAEADLDRAISLGFDQFKIWFLRGLIRELEGEPMLALADLEKAVESGDDPVSSQMHRVLVLRESRPESPHEPGLILSAGWKAEWPEAIGRYLAGELVDAELVRLAGQAPESQRRRTLCVAFYYLGRNAEQQGDITGAEAYYQKCLDTGAGSEVEFAASRIRLHRLNAKKSLP